MVYLPYHLVFLAKFLSINSRAHPNTLHCQLLVPRFPRLFKRLFGLQLVGTTWVEAQTPTEDQFCIFDQQLITVIPSSKLTWLAGKSPYLFIGDTVITSSNAFKCFHFSPCCCSINMSSFHMAPFFFGRIPIGNEQNRQETHALLLSFGSLSSRAEPQHGGRVQKTSHRNGKIKALSSSPPLEGICDPSLYSNSCDVFL